MTTEIINSPYFSGIVIFLVIVILYILIRNHMVFSFRTKLLRENRDIYYKLPSYDRMMLEFWKPLRWYKENR